MLDGVMLLWFLLTVVSLLFVVVDVRSTPAMLVDAPRLVTAYYTEASDFSVRAQRTRQLPGQQATAAPPGTLAVPATACPAA